MVVGVIGAIKKTVPSLLERELYIIVANLIDQNIEAKVVHVTVKKLPKKFKPGDDVWVKAVLADIDYNAHTRAGPDIYVKVFIYNTTNTTGVERVPLSDVKKRK